MDKDKMAYYLEEKRKLTERCEGKDPQDWAPSDKVRTIALLFLTFCLNPEEASVAFAVWAADGRTDIQDDLLAIADRMDA